MKKLIILSLLLGIFFTSESQTLKQGKNTLNISSLLAVDTVIIQTGITTSGTLALQIVYRNVTGTANGSFNLYQTIDESAKFVEFNNSALPYTISSANEVIGFEKESLPFSYMPIILTKNGMTGGYIDIYVKIKQQ